jgi:hypothetical protein
LVATTRIEAPSTLIKSRALIPTTRTEDEMRLDEFACHARDESARYFAPVTDESGEVTHELSIVGPDELIRASFAESDLTVTIRPDEHLSVEDLRKEWPRRQLPDLADHLPSAEVLRSAFDNPRAWAISPPPDPSPDHSIFVTLRSNRPGGTYYKVSGIMHSPGVGGTQFWTLAPSPVPEPSVFFARAGTVPLPRDGRIANVDLYMGTNGTSGAFPAASERPGPWPDAVELLYPWWLGFTAIVKVVSRDPFLGSYFLSIEGVSLI